MEPPVQRAPGEASGLPAGQVERIAAADLINRWPYPLLTGYVVLESQRPPAAPSAVAAIPAPAADTRLNWRNVSYALQWWAFAGFGLFLWWRAVRDAHESSGPAAEDPPDRDDPAAGGLARVGDHGSATTPEPGVSS
jgi:hypothetical protein